MDHPERYTRLIEFIREENSSRTKCVENQILCAIWFYENDVLARNDRSKRTSEIRESIGSDLQHQTDTVLENLTEIGVLGEQGRGGRSFVRNERKNRAFWAPGENEEAIKELIDEEIGLFIDALHARDRPLGVKATTDGGSDGEVSINPLRELVAEKLSTDENAVEAELREPDDPLERMEQYDPIVTAIKEDPEIEHRGEYDGMGWRNSANRYSLTQHAAALVESSALTDW